MYKSIKKMCKPKALKEEINYCGKEWSDAYLSPVCQTLESKKLKSDAQIESLKLSKSKIESARNTLLENNLNKKVMNCAHKSGQIFLIKDICPVGGEEFPVASVGTVRIQGFHLDWQPVYHIKLPEAISICPSNGFIIDSPNLTSEQIAKRKSYIETEEYKKLYNSKNASFYLFAKQSEYLKEHPDNLWSFYLKATWEAYTCEDKEKYNEYANITIEKAKQRKTSLTPKDAEYWMIDAVIVELYRRMSLFDLAQKHLNTMGIPNMEEKQPNDYYNLVKELQQKAINDKSNTPIPIKANRNIEAKIIGTEKSK